MFELNGRRAHWISSTEALRDVLARHLNDTRYALDTEFSMGKTYGTTLAVIQLGWDDEIALVDATTVDVTELRSLFATDSLALLHAAGGDLDVLDLTVGARPRRLYDTQVAAQFLGWSTPSLAALVQDFLHLTLDKSLQRTDWLVRPLSDAAQHYAASDVAYLSELADLLDAQLEARGRRAWVLAECAELLARVSEPTPPNELWWRLAKANTIPPSRRLSAQRLCMLRDQRAQHRDRPPSHILSDDVVLALVMKPPTSVDGVLRTKGVGSIPESFARDILRSLSDPDVAGELRPLPRRGFDSELEPLLNALVAVATQKAADLELDVKLLANKKDVTDYLIGEGQKYQVAWRRDVLGADFDRVRSGGAAIAVQDDRLRIIHL
jgi:ribonuclease D